VASPTETFRICYDEEAHEGCLSQSTPLHLEGFKPGQRVRKIHKKFRKKSRLGTADEVMTRYELHLCLCLEKGKEKGGEDSSALDLQKRIRIWAEG